VKTTFKMFKLFKPFKTFGTIWNFWNNLEPVNSSKAQTHFRRRRISLRLRLRSLRKVCLPLIGSPGTAESGLNLEL
jgi:hypothetical protein